MQLVVSTKLVAADVLVGFTCILSITMCIKMIHRANELARQALNPSYSYFKPWVAVRRDQQHHTHNRPLLVYT